MNNFELIRKFRPRWARRYPVLAALLLCAIATIALTPVATQLALANIAMLYLLIVVFVASSLGQRAATVTCFFSVALFDFFFVPPRFSFAVDDAQYLVTFAVMLAVALVISRLTMGLRRNAAQARLRETRTLELYNFVQVLNGTLTEPAALAAIRTFCDGYFSKPYELFMPDTSGTLIPKFHSGLQSELPLHAAIFTTYRTGEFMHSGHLAEEHGGARLIALKGATRIRGVFLVAGAPNKQDDLEQIGSVIATTIERLHFVEIAQIAQSESATERLRSTILSALSHDIRTPLTALYGLSDTLLLTQPTLDPEARATLVTMRDQALRLDHLVSNLLDMARLKAGKISLRSEWQPVEEVIGASLLFLRSALAAHQIKVRLAPYIPLLFFDAVLMERLLCNLLGNAAKYAPAGSEILLTVNVIGDYAHFEITNTGSQFPSGDTSQLFDLFERGVEARHIPGSGVGLSICRAIAHAHGGTIAAYNTASGSACVHFTLPLGTPPTVELDEQSESTLP